MSLIINYQTAENIDRQLFKAAYELVRTHFAIEGDIELTFVDNPTIQELNKEYRGKDYATDVLSWAFQEAEVQFGHELFGEVYISLDKIVEQAKEKGHPQNYEAAYIFIHGLLHLLGYDHHTDTEEQEMNELTEKFVNELPSELLA